MKSALEIAMEKSDGISRTKSLSLAQKEEIAEIRNIAKTKIAQEELQLAETIKKFSDMPEAFSEIESARENLMIVKGRIERDMEDRIEKVKNR